MNSHARYEILEPIAKGDYATIYRARDLELDREVAIKQIHQQYLEDPRQLERYWQEAQLLAKLEHPRIMTIYDIVRERGWLVLELMQGSLSQIQNGEPIDLNVLRMALTCGLHALHFLSQNGIIHGDVKPSNLLVDKNNRIKLGDFGIARRMSGDPGSIIKGTTKYMAPEVLSDQFGPVGPHSDLYSLGFSAYELMCGSHFDTLFPGLDMYGRDRQMAWMMWHSSPDRRLPEIKRVLQGVPEDLTYVVSKLIEKEPAKRYRTAEEVIHDLQALSQGSPPAAAAEENSAVIEAAKQAKRKRLLTFGALGVSVALCLAMLFLPTERNPPENGPPKPKLASGVLQSVKAEENVFFVSPPEGGPAVGIPFSRELDSVLLNKSKVELAQLEPGDQIEIKYLKSVDNREVKEISAARAEAERSVGSIAAIDFDARMLTISLGSEGKTLGLKAPASVRVLLNGSPGPPSKPLELADLRAGDQVVVSHVASAGEYLAQTIDATRRVSLEGVLVGVDTAAGKLVLRIEGEGAARKTLVVAKECEITLNGAAAIEGKVLALADLRPDDRLQLEHEKEVGKIAAFRLFTAEGVVQGLPDATSFAVKLPDREAAVRFSLAPAGRVELANSKTPVDLAYLRPGDNVIVSHDSPDLTNALARHVVVEGVADKRTWAAIVVGHKYDDSRLAEIPYAAQDGHLLRSALAGRYRVPEEQFLYLEDSSRLKIEQELERFLGKVSPGSQLVVYLLGHSFMTSTGAALLAPKEFDRANAEASGVGFKSLVSKIEACPAAEKILLVDLCHSPAGKPAPGQPSSSDVIESLRAPGGIKVSNSITFLASCGKGECAAVVERSGTHHGAFALLTAEAFRGHADANRDLRVDAAELYDYLSANMASVAATAGPSAAPARFLPDATPERITPGGKEAIRKLLLHVSAPRIDPRIVIDDVLTARELAPRQPEAALAHGLVLLKLGKGAEAQAQFEAVKSEHPDCSLAHHALAWLHFNQGNPQAGIDDLVQLIGSLPRPAKEGEWDAYSVHCQTFSGAMRQYALKAAATPLALAQLADLNEEVKVLDKVGVENFVKGLRSVDVLVEDLDRRIEAAVGNDKKPLELRRRTLNTYAAFDYALAVRFVREAMEK